MGAGTDYTSTESTDAGSIIQVIKLLHPVEFTDSSTGADSVLWSFGDGNTSTERNPIHNYSSNGTFIVTLTAYNEFGENSTSQTVIVSGIGVDSYEQQVESETIEEETTEEETIEESENFETNVSDSDLLEDLVSDDNIFILPKTAELELQTEVEDYINPTTTSTADEINNQKNNIILVNPLGELNMPSRNFMLNKDENFETNLKTIETIILGSRVRLVGIGTGKSYERVVIFIGNTEEPFIRTDAEIGVIDSSYQLIILN